MGSYATAGRAGRIALYLASVFRPAPYRVPAVKTPLVYSSQNGNLSLKCDRRPSSRPGGTMGELGKEIRRLREAKGWGQTKLAAAADMAVSGVS
jgi:hypothetical protein